MATAITGEAQVARTGNKPWYTILYVQVLIAILIGVVVGWLWPNLATNDWIKALGDGFIKLIRMVIAPPISRMPARSAVSASRRWSISKSYPLSRC
jgi:aerobic C4-dicarboxylate transport protein